jgi:PAS domain S-box-containing protein
MSSQPIGTLKAAVRFGIWEWSLADNVLMWSDELYLMLGLAPQSISPTLDEFVARVHPEDRTAMAADFGQLRRGKTQITASHRVIRADGEIRNWKASACARLDASGTPVRLIGTAEDITDDQERAARIVFSDRMRSVGTLAAGVAHEINNPLALISVNLELMIETLRAHPESVWSTVESMTQELRIGVERVRNIVRGLKTFAHADEANTGPLDVVHVVDLAIALVRHEIRHRAHLVTEFGPVPLVPANEARLGQVFVNLLLNAAQAIPLGAADQHEIRVSTREEAGRAVVEIRDSGAGIPVAIQPLVFDPFFTTRPIGEGTGLGLTICHNIVRSLGGTITFTSTPGAGTTFRVALPPATPIVKTPPVASTPGTAPRTRGRVLIVDDEAMFANSMRRLLSREHEVAVENSGRAALDRFRAGERFDVILCDLMMPELTGMDVHSALMELSPEQAARMVFLTGGAFTPAAQRFLDAHEGAFFEKPCDLQLLKATIRGFVQS